MEVNEMPRGNGTGPEGMGPMTGRREGYCGGNTAPGSWNPFGRGNFWGRGAGRGRGFASGIGRGMRSNRAQWTVPSYGQAPYLPDIGDNYSAGPTKEQELEMLKRSAEGVQNTMRDIQKRISELEAEPETGN
jgi:hypothetical protein